MTKVLEGKRGLIVGIANDHSIAWGIAKCLSEEGASMYLTYQNDSIKKRVEPLSQKINCLGIMPCDVSETSSLENVCNGIEGNIDFFVHAVAYSDKNELAGKYLNTSKENFLNTLHISAYSLTEMTRLLSPKMNNGSSIMALTYYGSTRYMQSYNVMGVAKAALETSIRYLAVDMGDRGIRVNAISAGPMRTLAGAVINKSRQIYNYTINNSPIKKPLSLDDIGKSSVYLMSDLSTGVTGEVLYVDNGYNNVGMSIQDL
jgi:enoyl-[acyl-carrier protein] reductase I